MFTEDLDYVVPLAVREVAEDTPDGGPRTNPWLAPSPATSNWFPTYSAAELRTKQLEDPVLSILHQWTQDGIPSKQEMAGKAPALRKHWLCWAQFELRDSVLYYSWEMDIASLAKKLLMGPVS